jgi:tetratricopeptide (TPR) repeat protein
MSPDTPTAPPPPEKPTKSQRKLGTTIVAALSLVGLIVGIIGGVLGILPERERNNVLYVVGIIGPSETPVPTATPTATLTLTPTLTPTPVPTDTPTPTETATPSLTPTPTPTATATATATTPPTATPSLTPTPTVTPMEGAPAAEGEVLAVVAQFSGEYNPQIDVVEALEDAAEDLSGVRVVAIGHPIANAAEAERIRTLYQAAMVVYGRTSEGGVTVYYDVAPNEARFQFGGIVRAQASEVDNFQVFLYNGMDVNYVLGLTLGQLHYFDGNYVAARQALRLAENALEPARLDELKADILYLYKGIVLQRLEDLTGAVTAYSRAIELNPEFAAAYLDRGSAQLELNDPDAAEADFRQAIVLDPSFPEAHYNLGTFYARAGRHEEAIAALGEAIRFRPDYVNAYINRGLAQLETDQIEAAIADYSEAIALDPENPSPYAQRGYAYTVQEAWEDAEADFDRAIALDAEYVYAYEMRALTRQRQGRHEEAIADYTRILSFAPSARAYTTRGQVYLQLQKLNSALDDFNHALELDPEYALAYRGRGYAHYLLGNDDETLADLRRYAELAGSIEPVFQELIDELAAQLET